MVGLTKVAGKQAGTLSLGMSAAARHRGRAARRPAGAAVRRTGQRPGPGGNSLDPHADADLGERGTHGVRLQPPARRDGQHRRSAGGDRPGQIDRRHDDGRLRRPSGVDSVRVRSPHLERLRRAVGGRRLAAQPATELLAGVTARRWSRSAISLRGTAITLHELSAQQSSLEEAYMKLTDDAVEYRASGAQSMSGYGEPNESSCRPPGHLCGRRSSSRVEPGLRGDPGCDRLRAFAAAARTSGHRRRDVRGPGADDAVGVDDHR